MRSTWNEVSEHVSISTEGPIRRELRAGAKIAGHRGYFLTNDGIDLNQALISYGLDFLRKQGYKKVQPPFMMNKEVMAKTAQLDQFDEELYKVRYLCVL